MRSDIREVRIATPITNTTVGHKLVGCLTWLDCIVPAMRIAAASKETLVLGETEFLCLPSKSVYHGYKAVSVSMITVAANFKLS